MDHNIIIEENEYRALFLYLAHELFAIEDNISQKEIYPITSATWHLSLLFRTIYTSPNDNFSD